MLGRTQTQPSNPNQSRSPARGTCDLDVCYRSLFAKLQCCDQAKVPLEVFGVIGSDIGSGASTTATNLAIAAAQSTQKTVLLVDADPGHPTVEAFFRLRPAPGVSEILRDHADPEDCFQKTQVENLWMLATGETEGSFLCNRDAIATFVHRLRNSFDFVILDLPAISTLGGGFLFLPLLDGVLLVVEPGKTQSRTAHHAKELLLRCDTKLIGVVCTKVRRTESEWD